MVDPARWTNNMDQKDARIRDGATTLGPGPRNVGALVALEGRFSSSVDGVITSRLIMTGSPSPTELDGGEAERPLPRFWKDRRNILPGLCMGK